MSKIKAFVENLDGKPILVYGLGKSGMSTIKALAGAGAYVVAGDDNQESLDGLGDVPILGQVDIAMADYAFVVLSPGIPFTHPEPHEIVKAAQDVGVEVICDIELFTRIYGDVKTIGITGTNGKSTTAALVHHILAAQGVNCALAGNIGVPIFDVKPKADMWLVLEISSYQIDLCSTFRPDIGVLLNISPDHIDRHGTLEHYMDVKARILEADHAILCVDDEHTKKITAKYPNAETLSDTDFQKDIEELTYLKGAHNKQNVAAACAVVEKIDLSVEQVWPDIKSFRGLPHRQYLVRTINGVAYVNDSKATNAASAAVALTAQDNIYWIVGGRKKKNGLEGLEAFFPQVKHAFLIGEATQDFAQWLGNYGVDYTMSYDLENAVGAAHKMAQDHRSQPGGAGVVMLSPACASFDQFKSFEERGDVFTEFVEGLGE